MGRNSNQAAKIVADYHDGGEMQHTIIQLKLKEFD
jgi:hypothetical protein